MPREFVNALRATKDSLVRKVRMHVRARSALFYPVERYIFVNIDQLNKILVDTTAKCGNDCGKDGQCLSMDIIYSLYGINVGSSTYSAWDATHSTGCVCDIGKHSLVKRNKCCRE